MDNNTIEYISPSALSSYKNNARTHSEKQISQITNSIERFGFLNPVLVDNTNTIIAGHGRVQAAKKLKLSQVPICRFSHLSEDEKRAYILADNKLATKAGWDSDILSIELKHLMSVSDNLSIDLTGFEMPEIDMVVLGNKEDETESIIEQCLTSNTPATTCLGDLWILGNHKVYCGNALSPQSFDTLLGSEKAQMIFTDPPYNVRIDGHVCGSGKIKHNEFDMASGEMTQQEFTDFLKETFKQLVAYSVNGSLHFICMDWRHLIELSQAGDTFYSEFKNLCIWNKNNGGMGSLYRSKHELIFVYKNGKDPHINNIELGKNGRYRTNVWDYDGMSGKQDLLKLHPTVKPVSMISDAILDCTHHNNIVLDCFGGSGSTLMACERTHRHARLIELSPKYVDATITRWQKETNQDAIHADTGMTFNALKEVKNNG